MHRALPRCRRVNRCRRQAGGIVRTREGRASGGAAWRAAYGTCESPRLLVNSTMAKRANRQRSLVSTFSALRMPGPRCYWDSILVARDGPRPARECKSAPQARTTRWTLGHANLENGKLDACARDCVCLFIHCAPSDASEMILTLFILEFFCLLRSFSEDCLVMTNDLNVWWEWLSAYQTDLLCW